MAKGTCFIKKLGKWQARITVNGKRPVLGYFDTEEEAHAAYLTARKEAGRELEEPCPDGYKRCSRCREIKQKTTEHFYISTQTRDGSDWYCKKCRTDDQTTRDRRYRLIVLNHYSHGRPQCECCGEDEITFLAIDHINGGGTKERLENGMGGRFFKWVIKNNFPEGLRILCHNCNHAVAFGRVCPHQTKKQVSNAGS